MKKIIFKSRMIFKPCFIAMVILNRVNHYICKLNQRKYPQLAILSFDHIGLRINIDGRYERDSLNFVKDFLFNIIGIEKNTTVLDVGANIGNHSVFFSFYFDKVISFEPNPSTYFLLEYNSVGRNIIPHNYGLSDCENSVLFFQNKINTGGSKIIESSNSEGDNIRINVRRLDDIIDDKENISLIKIDVEGHEFQVLNGAKRIINRNNPVILFEQGKEGIKNGRSNVINLLSDLGYEFYVSQERFYFGESLISKVFHYIACSLFGYQNNMIKIDFFENRFYDMVVAIKR